MSHFGNDSTMT